VSGDGDERFKEETYINRVLALSTIRFSKAANVIFLLKVVIFG
jgi:hypothetical protein